LGIACACFAMRASGNSYREWWLRNIGIPAGTGKRAASRMET
jgi:hypothetical protein